MIEESFGSDSVVGNVRLQGVNGKLIMMGERERGFMLSVYIAGHLANHI